MTAPLLLHNTMTRRKEEFQPLRDDLVTMYVCGPTVYNYAHLGNARPAVVFDVLARVLRNRFPCLIYARNFTDIDDKINAAAEAGQTSIATIAERYIQAYREDMRNLGVDQPDLEPRVTEHIDAIIQIIAILILKGHAYAVQGHVLFDVASFPQYGLLSGRSQEELIAGARVEIAPYKNNPADFVLWKPSSAQEPGWPSPWGRGRPGWHIECTAMIGRHLGTPIDIHGGGQDLIFPHHENEIAQGTCAHDGQLYCKTWLHNSFVTVNGQKMSKSIGNVLLVKDLLRSAPGEAIRLALLMTHYRHPLDWTLARLRMAVLYSRRLSQALQELDEVHVGHDELRIDPLFLAQLHNDLNTPAALVRLQALAREARASTDPQERRRRKGVLLGSANLLGILLPDSQGQVPEVHENAHASADRLSDEAIDRILQERDTARSQRNYLLADQLRVQLDDAGVAIEDSANGTRWQWHDKL